ncbi:NtaA/DmoA family FMN-dependent monooxygenase [Burkholderia multivorans]|uniref:NtaA/DmoA family FMN-dependent monooxygenase n=1 Tax=Burkholderia multivorans TaxID=87883 RepID=UPI003735FC67
MAKFHLGWFTNARPHGWGVHGPIPWSGHDSEPSVWESGEFLVDLVRSLERGCFDYLMLEDHSVVADTYGGSMEVDLRHAIRGARLDPLPLIAYLAAHTKRLGLVATLPTTFYSPFMLARHIATIDHLSRGRAGWNIVTGSEHQAAQAYGIGEAMPPHDERYARADEFVEIAKQLWDAWEPDAVRADAESGIYADHTRVRGFDFHGEYYRSRGPLNVSRSPQGRPVFCQAGSSPRGREFGARHADTIIASASGPDPVAALKAFRDDIRQRRAAVGLDPNGCKVLFPVLPILATTDDEAQRLADVTPVIDQRAIDYALAGLSADNNLDFAQFDLDKPLPELTTQGHVGSLEKFRAQGKTLREMVEARITGKSKGTLQLVGSPRTVAKRMGEVIEEIGGDGFLIHAFPLTRRYVSEVVDGLVPELQRLGLVRTAYEHEQFRDNLLAF